MEAIERALRYFGGHAIYIDLQGADIISYPTDTVLPEEQIEGIATRLVDNWRPKLQSLFGEAALDHGQVHLFLDEINLVGWKNIVPLLKSLREKLEAEYGKERCGFILSCSPLRLDDIRRDKLDYLRECFRGIEMIPFADSWTFNQFQRYQQAYLPRAGQELNEFLLLPSSGLFLAALGNPFFIDEVMKTIFSSSPLHVRDLPAERKRFNDFVTELVAKQPPRPRKPFDPRSIVDQDLEIQHIDVGNLYQRAFDWTEPTDMVWKLCQARHATTRLAYDLIAGMLQEPHDVSRLSSEEVKRLMRQVDFTTMFTGE
ncbi:hypothetical protein FJY90_04970 [Candidatus Gottesmanbacteria bacterium]|nr:hypothetical protein [Candidatus Gottesmanbacteria bacterium]